MDGAHPIQLETFQSTHYKGGRWEFTMAPFSIRFLFFDVQHTHLSYHNIHPLIQLSTHPFPNDKYGDSPILVESSKLTNKILQRNKINGGKSLVLHHHQKSKCLSENTPISCAMNNPSSGETLPIRKLDPLWNRWVGR